jgi:hypothetical protein
MKAQEGTREQRTQRKQDRLSLHPLTLDDALKGAMATGEAARAGEQAREADGDQAQDQVKSSGQ